MFKVTVSYNFSNIAKSSTKYIVFVFEYFGSERQRALAIFR